MINYKKVREKLSFQVRVTNNTWLEHLSSISNLDAANFWTNRPYRDIGQRIIFVRKKESSNGGPRKIAGWGTLESIGEMDSIDGYWDARDIHGSTTSDPNSIVANFTHYMILTNIELLGENEPLETDIFNEENGYEPFHTVRGPSKTYTGDFPNLLDDRESVEILSRANSTGVKEGGKKYVSHVKRERRATKKFRNQMIYKSQEMNNGKVPCEVCKEDMLGKYKVGVAIIDCHHLFPLSEILDDEVITTIDDLALLCPSCHRAIHKLDDCSNLNELRSRLE